MNLSAQKKWLPLLLLFICCAVCLRFFTYNNNFSLAIHHDEPKKAVFLEKNKQDFKHPILMLQSIRLAQPNVFGDRSMQRVLHRGRGVSSWFGLIGIALFFCLVWYLSNYWTAFFVTMAVGLSPMIVLHAHYVKEDIYLFAGLMLTVLAHSLWVTKKNSWFVLLLALGLGVSFSSHYKSVIYAIVIILMTPWVGKKFIVKYLIGSFIAGLIGLGIFALINFPMFENFEVFKTGLLFEKDHALDGHTVKLWPTAWWFTFHIQKSLFLGIGIIPTILGFLGLFWALFKWKTLKQGERVLAIFTLVFYFVVELSPLKPHPGYIRYALPTVPGLMYFLHKGLVSLANRFQLKSYLTYGGMVAITIGLGTLSQMRMDEFEPDTRKVAEEKYKRQGLKYAHEKYTNDEGAGLWSIGQLKPDTFTKPFDVFVISNFIYDRYLLGQNLPEQKRELYYYAEVYNELMKLPSEEVRTPRGPFGFHNPIVRIIDVRNADLKTIYRRAKEKGEANYKRLNK